MNKTRFFIFIMALMMTLLLVVGCDVSPLSNDCLINARLSISDSRGIQIYGGDGTIKKYKIAMIPEWVQSEIDEQIVGWKGSIDENGIVTGYEDISYIEENGGVSIDLGYISQGKWSIYINAYNNNDVLIYSGKSSGYINKENSNIVIVLNRATGNELNGYMGFFIRLNQLCINEGDHYNKYGLKYEVYTLDGNKALDDSVNKYLNVYSKFGNTINYGSWDESVRLAPNDYYVTISLVKNPKKSNEKVVGGITRFVSIYPGSKTDSHTWTMIDGDVVPSDFIQVGIDFPAPEITATMKLEKSGNNCKFSCEDKYNNLGNNDFSRYYRWFIDGELVEEGGSYGKWEITSISTTSNDSNVSTMECVFSKLGEREVRCEVVYVPKIIEGVDSKPLHFVGGVSEYVQVL